MLAVTADQLSPISGNATDPAYLVAMQWGTDVQWCSSGDQDIDSGFWAGGMIGLRSIADGKAATLVMPPTPDNMQVFLSGAWRGKYVPPQKGLSDRGSGHTLSGQPPRPVVICTAVM